MSPQHFSLFNSNRAYYTHGGSVILNLIWSFRLRNLPAMVAWLSGSALVLISIVILRRARLILGWWLCRVTGDVPKLDYNVRTRRAPSTFLAFRSSLSARKFVAWQQLFQHSGFASGSRLQCCATCAERPIVLSTGQVKCQQSFQQVPSY